MRLTYATEKPKILILVVKIGKALNGFYPKNYKGKHFFIPEVQFC